MSVETYLLKYSWIHEDYISTVSRSYFVPISLFHFEKNMSSCIPNDTSSSLNTAIGLALHVEMWCVPYHFVRMVPDQALAILSCHRPEGCVWFCGQPVKGYLENLEERDSDAWCHCSGRNVHLLSERYSALQSSLFLPTSCL